MQRPRGACHLPVAGNSEKDFELTQSNGYAHRSIVSVQLMFIISTMSWTELFGLRIIRHDHREAICGQTANSLAVDVTHLTREFDRIVAGCSLQ